MDNFFGGRGGGALRLKRKLEKDPSQRFSPSYGVRNGFLADVERTREDGNNQRGAKRVPASFEICFDGTWTRLSGDLSAGGALVLSEKKAESTEVQVRIKLDGTEWTLTGEVLNVQRRAQRFAHHVKFTQPEEAKGLEEALAKSIDEETGRVASEPSNTK